MTDETARLLGALSCHIGNVAENILALEAERDRLAIENKALQEENERRQTLIEQYAEEHRLMVDRLDHASQRAETAEARVAEMEGILHRLHSAISVAICRARAALTQPQQETDDE